MKYVSNLVVRLVLKELSTFPFILQKVLIFMKKTVNSYISTVINGKKSIVSKLGKHSSMRD